MGIARELLNAEQNNLTECMELASLLAKGNVRLVRLNLEFIDLPNCLQPYYEYNND